MSRRKGLKTTQMKVLRFVIYTSTSLLGAYLILLGLCTYLEGKKTVEPVNKNWRFINPESETNIKNDCYE